MSKFDIEATVERIISTPAKSPYKALGEPARSIMTAEWTRDKIAEELRAAVLAGREEILAYLEEAEGMRLSVPLPDP